MDSTVRRMKPKVLLAKACISVLFFVVLFSSLREGEFSKILSQVDPFYFTLSFLLIPVMIPSSCLKWKVLLAQHGRRISFFFLMRIYLIGYFFSNMLPSNVGGDVVRSYYIGRHIGDQYQAAVSTFIERFTGIILLLILAIVAPALKPSLYRSPLVFMPALGAVGLLSIMVWMWRVPEPLRLPRRVAMGVLGFVRKKAGTDDPGVSARGVDRFERFLDRTFSHLEKFHQKLLLAIGALKGHARALWAVVMLTIFFYFMTWVNVYVSFRAFGVDPDFLGISALVPAAMLVAMMPVTLLGNLGFTEGVFVVFFGLLEIGSAEALSMGLLIRLKLLVVGIVGFLFYITYKHREHDFSEAELIPVADDVQAEGEHDG